MIQRLTSVTRGVSGLLGLLGLRPMLVYLSLVVGALSATFALMAGDAVLAAFLLLGGVILALLVNTRGITDVNFIFIGFFSIYQLFCPFLYYYEISWVAGIHWVEDKHNVYLASSLISVAALAAYALGGWLSGLLAQRPVAARYQLLSQRRAWIVFALLVATALGAWLVTFVYAGYPVDNFMGRVPADRHRGYFGGLTAHAYFLTLPFQMNVALLVLLICRPRLQLYSPTVLFFLYATVVFNSMSGSRLALFLLPLAFIMMKNLLADANGMMGDPRFAYRRPEERLRGYPWWLLAGLGGGLYFFALFYGYYRSGIGGEFFKTLGWFNFTNIFDTSITFQFVLDKVPEQIEYWWGAGLLMPLLNRVPTVLLPEKYELMFDSAMFTDLLYGYDQRDPDAVSRSASLFADLFINHGVFGVLVGVGLIGLLNGWLWRRVARRGASNLFLVLYVVYSLYYLPVLFKVGLYPSLTHLDIMLLPLLAFVILLAAVALRRREA